MEKSNIKTKEELRKKAKFDVKEETKEELPQETVFDVFKGIREKLDEPKILNDLLCGLKPRSIQRSS